MKTEPNTEFLARTCPVKMAHMATLVCGIRITNVSFTPFKIDSLFWETITIYFALYDFAGCLYSHTATLCAA